MPLHPDFRDGRYWEERHESTYEQSPLLTTDDERPWRWHPAANDAAPAVPAPGR